MEYIHGCLVLQEQIQNTIVNGHFGMDILYILWTYRMDGVRPTERYFFI